MGVWGCGLGTGVAAGGPPAPAARGSQRVRAVHWWLMRKYFVLFIPLMTACISMQPRRFPDGQDASARVAHLQVRLRSGEQFDLYDAIVRTDSVIGRTQLVVDAPQQALATADVAQLKEQKLSPLRTAALSALVLVGLVFTAVVVILAALFSASS